MSEKEPSAYELLQEQCRQLQTRQAQIREMLGDPDREWEQDQRLNGYLEKISKAVGDVAKHMLAYEKVGAQAAKKLTREQRLELVAPFFSSCTPEEQRKLLQELTGIYNARRAA